MPFGLYNAPATFQRLMNLTFADFINEFLKIYLNDILVYLKLINSTWIILGKFLSI